MRFEAGMGPDVPARRDWMLDERCYATRARCDLFEILSISGLTVEHLWKAVRKGQFRQSIQDTQSRPQDMSLQRSPVPRRVDAANGGKDR